MCTYSDIHIYIYVYSYICFVMFVEVVVSGKNWFSRELALFRTFNTNVPVEMSAITAGTFQSCDVNVVPPSIYFVRSGFLGYPRLHF